MLPLTPHIVHPAFEDGTDTRFRNVGQLQFDAGEIPRRKYTIFKSRRKSEIKNTSDILYIFFWVFPGVKFDAGEIPRRKYTIFKSRRKSEIYNNIYVTL